MITGCVFAFKTRKLDPKYGEAKQLGFTMYNIAFVAIVVILLVGLVDMDGESRVVLSAVGIGWGTVFSAFAFVLPRLLEVVDNKSVVHHSTSFKVDSGGHQVLVMTPNEDNHTKETPSTRPHKDLSILPTLEEGSTKEIPSYVDGKSS